MKKLKNIFNKFVSIFKKNINTEIEIKEEDLNFSLEEIAKIIEQEHQKKLEQEKVQEIKQAMVEFNHRVNNHLNNFIYINQNNPNLTKNKSVKEYQEELATSLAIQSFVKKVKFSFFEIDQLSDTALIGIEVFPSKKIIEDTSPMIIKLNVESVSHIFGKGFSGEENPFYEDI